MHIRAPHAPHRSRPARRASRVGRPSDRRISPYICPDARSFHIKSSPDSINHPTADRARDLGRLMSSRPNSARTGPHSLTTTTHSKFTAASIHSRTHSSFKSRSVRPDGRDLTLPRHVHPDMAGGGRPCMHGTAPTDIRTGLTAPGAPCIVRARRPSGTYLTWASRCPCAAHAHNARNSRLCSTHVPAAAGSSITFG